MNSRVVCALPSLGFLFGHIFMWSNNSSMFTSKALITSLCCIIFFSCILFLINYYVILPTVNIIFKNFSGGVKKKALNLIISCVFIFTSWIIIDYNIFLQNIIFAPILCIMTFGLLSLNKEKAVLFFMVIMLLFSSIHFISMERAQFIEDDITSFKKKLLDIKFDKKPNIYLFWLESYNDFEMFKNIHKIDMSLLQNILSKNNFIVQNKSYSSGFYTLMAFTQLYTCGYCDNNKLTDVNPNIFRGSLEVSKGMRRLVGGDKNNLVFRILKTNGYKTFMITQGDMYYTQTQGEYLDEIDLAISAKNNAMLYNYLYPAIKVSIFNKRIESFFQRYRINSIYKGGLEERVAIAMRRGKQSGKPYFITFKGGANHTPESRYKYSQENRRLWIEREYKKMVERGNLQASNIIDYIVSHDPNALIILLGDHGPWTYRESWYNIPTSYPDDNVSELDIFDDFCRVLFAYRLPGGVRADISHGMYLSNINIFMHIFAYLADDPGILKYRFPSVSQLELGGTKLVEGQLARPK